MFSCSESIVHRSRTESLWDTLHYALQLIYIWFVIVFVCLLVNIKTAELIGPKFFVGPHMTPGKACGTSKLKNLFLTDNEMKKDRLSEQQ